MWFDERVRQAVSMSIDRDLMIDTLNNVQTFTNAGLPVEKRWNSHLPLGEAEFWIDPQSKDFGDTAKYFKYDLSEANKLVRAATGKDKAEAAWTVISGNDYGQSYTQQETVLMSMLQEGPFKLNRVAIDYNTQFVRVVSAAPRLTGGHEFDGMAYGRIASFPEVDSYFGNHLYPGGTFFKFEENFPPADDKWYQLIKAQQLEQDRKRRIELIKEWQRYAAQKMYIIPHPGQATTFGLSWPWAGNVGAFSSRGGTPEITLWLDKSKLKTS
jgi:ABC-type transport system substrate-binding protein